jgi:hypothetical protein
MLLPKIQSLNFIFEILCFRADSYYVLNYELNKRIL